jgi:hypothetical protein
MACSNKKHDRFYSDDHNSSQGQRNSTGEETLDATGMQQRHKGPRAEIAATPGKQGDIL